MARHLAEPFIRSALNLGRAVEQFLGGFTDGEDPAIRWLALRQDGSGVVVSLYEALDEGGEDWMDVYEFTRANGDPDEPEEPSAEHPCDSLEEALALAADLYGAAPDRFVNEGMVQDEYLDFVRRQRRNA